MGDVIVGVAIDHCSPFAPYSGMAHGPVNWLLQTVLSKENTKVFYTAATCVYLRFTFTFWAPMPYLLWDLQQRELRMLVFGESR